VSAEQGGGRMPDFLVIGAMKGGSTTLFRLLAQHPQIFMCEPKEPGFFSRPERYARGLAWYASLFAAAKPGQLAGEASTCYSRAPHFSDVPALAAKHLPDVKLVYQLRHPVERAYSHFRHLMEERFARNTGPVIPLRTALQEIPEILDASRYAMQIERYLAHFPRERLHVLTLDDLRAHPAETWRALQRFLGASVQDLDAGALGVDNEYGTKVARGGMRSIIRRIRALPGWQLAKRLLPKPLRGGVRGWLLRPDVARRFQRARVAEHREQLAPLDSETRELMLAALADDLAALEPLLGRALPDWRR
jgi:hypothetical protein